MTYIVLWAFYFSKWFMNINPYRIILATDKLEVASAKDSACLNINVFCNVLEYLRYSVGLVNMTQDLGKTYTLLECSWRHVHKILVPNDKWHYTVMFKYPYRVK